MRSTDTGADAALRNACLVEASAGDIVAHAARRFGECREYQTRVWRWRSNESALTSMPFTPFHFGPAALFKALAPRYVSLTAFVASQVVIDLESGYHLIRGDWPVHRLAHTVLVATGIGFMVGTCVWLAGRRVPVAGRAALHTELRALPAHVGGLSGGLSHAVLDAILHADVEPLWPFSTSNPLLGALDVAPLHLTCVAAGACGALVFICKGLLQRRAR